VDAETGLIFLKIAGVVIALVTAYLVIGIIVHRVTGTPMRLNPYYRPAFDNAIWFLTGLASWAARRDAGYRCRSCNTPISPSDRRLGLYDLRDHLCERCFHDALNPHLEKGAGS